MGKGRGFNLTDLKSLGCFFSSRPWYSLLRIAAELILPSISPRCCSHIRRCHRSTSSKPCTNQTAEDSLAVTFDRCPLSHQFPVQETYRHHEVPPIHWKVVNGNLFFLFLLLVEIMCTYMFRLVSFRLPQYTTMPMVLKAILARRGVGYQVLEHSFWNYLFMC